jgi:hypothetical protein
MRSTRTLTMIMVAALCGACGSGRGTGSGRQPDTGTLSFTSKTSALVAGVYTNGGSTLRFSISPSALSLADTSGMPLLSFQSSTSGSVTGIWLGGQATVNGWIDANDDDHETDQGDVDAATAALFARNDFLLLPSLSPALAAQGADASLLPVTMRLHSLASQGSLGAGIDATGSTLAEYPSMCADMGGAPGAKRLGAAACQDLQSDPYCNNCLGMCGPGCTCWRWVCGDCCWHRGCYRHDLHCRRCDKRHKKDCLLCVLFDFGRPAFTCN